MSDTLNATWEEVAASICDHPVPHNLIWSRTTTESPVRFGDFVVSAPDTEGVQTIGYVVQIRQRWGEFGSDLYFIRRRDGSLLTAENQLFWTLTSDQVERVRPYFRFLPPDERASNPELEYQLQGGADTAKGFLITSPNPNRPRRSCFTLTVQTHGDAK